jgi:hypothetical protein
MFLTADDLQRIAARTLAHYDQHAQSYWEGTRDHDVSQNIDALLQSIEAPPPFELPDLGCGPGRDLKTFTAVTQTQGCFIGSMLGLCVAVIGIACRLVRLTASTLHSIHPNRQLLS